MCEDKDIYDDTGIQGAIKEALSLKEFKGDKDDTVTLYGLPGIKARRVVFRGLGKFEKIDREALRVMAGKTVKSCIQKDPADLWFAVPEANSTVWRHRRF